MSIEALKSEYEHAPREQRQAVLSRIYQSLQNAPKAELDAATRVLMPLIRVPSPNQAADVALILGALVELGADPAPLARALLAPLTRWVSAAVRFASQAQDFDDAPDDIAEDDVLELGEQRLFRADVDQLHEEDPEAVAAWFSLEVWFRPAVAALTRAPEVLRQAHGDAALRGALRELGRMPGGAYWLRVLLYACFGERLVVLYLPEVEERLPGLLASLSKRGIPNLWVPDRRDCYPVDAMPVLGSGKLDLKKLGDLAKQLAAKP